MSEKYDFCKEDTGPSTWFNHLLLQSDVRKVADTKGFNSRDMTITLNVNGVDILIEDFNQVLDQWSDRIAEDIKRKLEFMKEDKAVEDKARQLVEDKLGNIMSTLTDMEDKLWMLEV